MPDGELAEHQDELAERLAEHMAAATHVLSPWSRDGHPDHEACASAAARQACAHWQFPVWAWHWATPEQLPWSRMARVDLDRRARHAKRAAIAAYPSQHARLSAAPGDEAIVPAHVLAHFDRPFETFVVSSTAPAAHVAYFDDLYANAPDPWGLAGRFYERRKRELVIACLPRQRFTRAFEPGCATGELTVRLAERCDEVLAWDAAAAAVAQARPRAARPGVAVEQGNVPRQWPVGTFDLVVLSEIGYYCTDLDLLVQRLRCSLTDDGVVLACHWRRAAPDHPKTAEAVHAALADGLGALRRVMRHEEPDFLLDVWSGDTRSVAEAEGIVG
jgi:SAM-dependent methyltransferase